MFALLVVSVLSAIASLRAELQTTISHQDRGAGSAAQAPPHRDALAPWERLVDGAIENQGVAQIERFGTRWVLTVQCHGTHQTYLDDQSQPPTQYVDRYLRARYHYVDRTVKVSCVRPPCAPVRERRISIETITVLPLTSEQALTAARQCD
jgi:hypothetical protein